MTGVLVALAAQAQKTHEAKTTSASAETILAQMRDATGGDAWTRVAELRSEGTLIAGSQLGTIWVADDLRTGANADRIELQGVGQVEDHADTPTQDWETDGWGYVTLSPGGKQPGDIDDMYIHRHGWWEPQFGHAAITVLEPAEEGGETYDRLQCAVPGGEGFTLWVSRTTHFLTRIEGKSETTSFSDFRRTDSGLTLPFRKEKGTGKNAVAFVTTKLTALPAVAAEDFTPPFRRDYTLPPSGQVTVPAEGGLTFDMRINGQGPFKAVFDTGGMNGMTVAFARKLGLRFEDVPVAFGAIGGAIKVHMAHVDTLRIGDLELRDQLFYVFNAPDDVDAPPLITGWELMRRFAVRVDYEHGQLTFFDGPGFKYAGDGAAIPLILNKHGNGAELRAEVDGIPGVFTLDTGNEIGLFLNSQFVDEHTLVSALHPRFLGFNGSGLGGVSPPAWFARLPSLRIGSVELKDTVARLQTKPDGPYSNAGNIGQNVLQRFTLVVDCMRSVMYLEKTADWNKPEVFNRAGLVLNFANGVDEVRTVVAGGPGALTGLKEGDRITAVNGKPPASDPNDPVFLQPVGTVVHLAVNRGGADLTFDVTLKDVL